MGGDRYQQALKILDDALVFGIDPSLDGITALMDKMGNPQNNYPTIHIAGTNGKSSTTRQIATMLQAHGYKTGVYVKPHLVEYRERFELEEQVVSKEMFADAIIEAKRVADTLEGMTITEFEIATAAFYQICDQEKVDVAIVECGMGGRWDATSVIHPDVAVVTGIGLDHLGILGDTIEEIAGEKAAIIEEGCKTVLGPGTQSTLQVFADRVNEVGVKPWLVRCSDDVAAMESGEGAMQADISGYVSYDADYGEDPETIKVDVHGMYADYDGIVMRAPLYQAQNIATAIAATELYMGHAMDPDKVRAKFSTFTVPGRFETLNQEPLLIIDAAHNPQSAMNLATAIAKKFPDGDFQLLLAVLADKDAHGIIEALSGLTPDIAVTQTTSPRALSRLELADMVEDMTGTRPEVFESVETALDELMQRGVPIVASGSITLAGEVKGVWQKQERQLSAGL